jgi:2,3-diketo-5-methylthiopentyl-1-phosphate enolase
MEQFHDPIIFENAIDSIDMKDHIIATYYMKDRLEGVDFIDHFKLVEAMTVEGSTGSWEKVKEDSEEVRLMLTGKVVGYYNLPPDDEHTKAAVVQLAFPINAWDDNIPMALLSIAGNCFAYSDSIRLLDVTLPENMVKNFTGPKFGIDGIREMLGVPERPLSLHIIKPKMGMTPKQTGDQVFETAMGGVDMCKDDEMTSDTYNNKFEDRLKYVMDAIDRAAEKTGKRVIYYLSITDEVGKMYEKAKKAVELGANGLLITFSAGLSAFRRITADPDINIPVMMHNSHQIGSMKSISWPVWTKLIRLCGADNTLTPTYWSSIPMVSLEEGLRCSHLARAKLFNIKRMWPQPAAGLYPGLAPIVIPEFGKDIILAAGGGMLGHPYGYREGAEAWRQAIDAVMNDIPIDEYARKKENKSLRGALEKWGYMERPVTPWLRVAPKFHPKPFSME